MYEDGVIRPTVSPGFSARGLIIGLRRARDRRPRLRQARSSEPPAAMPGRGQERASRFHGREDIRCLRLLAERLADGDDVHQARAAVERGQHPLGGYRRRSSRDLLGARAVGGQVHAAEERVPPPGAGELVGALLGDEEVAPQRRGDLRLRRRPPSRSGTRTGSSRRPGGSASSTPICRSSSGTCSTSVTPCAIRMALLAMPSASVPQRVFIVEDRGLEADAAAHVEVLR